MYTAHLRRQFGKEHRHLEIDGYQMYLDYDKHDWFSTGYANMNKNRYMSGLPLDGHRVRIACDPEGEVPLYSPHRPPVPIDGSEDGEVSQYIPSVPDTLASDGYAPPVWCDYINASHVFHHNMHFIGCQAPLDTDRKKTIPEFWAMVYQQRAGVIVMLTRLVECIGAGGVGTIPSRKSRDAPDPYRGGGDPDSEWERKRLLDQQKRQGVSRVRADRYWPMAIGGVLEYHSVYDAEGGDGMLRVTLTAQRSLLGCIEVRRFSLSHTPYTQMGRDGVEERGGETVDSTPYEVVHYQYMDWPDRSAPNNTRELIELIHMARTQHARSRDHPLRVRHRERVSAQAEGETHPIPYPCIHSVPHPFDTPIIVHCSAGLGRAGTYIAAHIATQSLDSCGCSALPPYSSVDIRETAALAACQSVSGVSLSPSLLPLSLIDLVRSLRQQRNHSIVQSEDQYVFLHRLVDDFYLSVQAGPDRFRPHRDRPIQQTEGRTGRVSPPAPSLEWGMGSDVSGMSITGWDRERDMAPKRGRSVSPTLAPSRFDDDPSPSEAYLRPGLRHTGEREARHLREREREWRAEREREGERDFWADQE
ncbi:hypothetical protein KIPB_000184 [Kipferlia bialata]|uniref:Uncharacterized protein n=1 Tax=Kipferlia bialata TaxID=797122 RepID=A0A9K3GEI0_9EUKA|nr:hypothetical protein KIPB_000184 [Kipferlia bialata]|eukprot:g184.t1